MKQHTTKGCEILKNVPEIMDEGIYNYSYDICRHHHERWDGRGYPDGLFIQTVYLFRYNMLQFISMSVKFHYVIDSTS